MIAGIVGFGAGFAAPVEITSAIFNIGTANIIQYVLTQFSHGDTPELGGIIWSGAIGALSGFIGGVVTQSSHLPFAEDSRWLDPNIAHDANVTNGLAAAIGLEGFLRSVGGGIVSNLPNSGTTCSKTAS